MKKVIVSMRDCQNCATLKAMVPDASNLEIDPMDFLPFCRAAGIQNMPFLVVTGTVPELAKLLEDKDVQE